MEHSRLHGVPRTSDDFRYFRTGMTQCRQSDYGLVITAQMPDRLAHASQLVVAAQTSFRIVKGCFTGERLDTGKGLLPTGTALARPQCLQRLVAGDTEDPARYCRLAAKSPGIGPDRVQRIRTDFVGKIGIAEHSECKPVDRGVVLPEEPLEGGTITVCHGFEQDPRFVSRAFRHGKALITADCREHTIEPLLFPLTRLFPLQENRFNRSS